MDPYYLSGGPHKNADEGRCAMEFVALIAGEGHTDNPSCVSPVLRLFCMALNDASADEQRQRLRPYLARCIGTANDGLDRARCDILGVSYERWHYPSGAVWRKGFNLAYAHECGAYADGPKYDFDEALRLLDQMLPKVAIDLPEPAAAKARELCGPTAA